MQALKLDPGNKEAIIALAASLTNESMQSQACYALQGSTYLYIHSTLGVKVHNMKMDFNIYGTWRRVGQ